ncbi:MAG: DUF2975 domain-containing protein [Clostridium sp.]
MKEKIIRGVLGCYDLVLASGAIYMGSKMVLGLFWAGEFPQELFILGGQKMKKTFRGFLYGLSIMCVGLVIIAAALLPKLVDLYFLNFMVAGEGFSKLEVIIFLYIVAIPFLLICISVVKLSKRLLDGKVFNKSSMKELKIISYCSFIDFTIFCVGTFFIFRNLVCIVVMMGTLLVFIITSIVRELIESGIELQEDVDLTI